MIVTFGLHPIDPATGLAGHDDAPGMAVTGMTDAINPDGSYVVGYVFGTSAAEVRDHLFDFQGPQTHLPGNEAIADVWQSLRQHLAPGAHPTWVAVEAQQRDPSNAADFERFLAEFYRCDRGVPADVEDTHHTLHGNRVYAPGERPAEAYS